MRIEPFKPYHVELLKAQGIQGAQLGEISFVPQAPPASAGPAITAFDGSVVIACGGIIDLAGMGMCWALMSDIARLYMTPIHYTTKRLMTLKPWRRLEATVDESFAAGCRWVDLLGFKFEGAMPGYGPKGETHLRYGKCLI